MDAEAAEGVKGMAVAVEIAAATVTAPTAYVTAAPTAKAIRAVAQEAMDEGRRQRHPPPR